MSNLLGDVTAVLMAKEPAHGAKTRLSASGGYSPRVVAELAEAMLCCIAQRLQGAAGRLVLAVSPDGCGPRLAGRLGLGSVPVVDQGPGDLGQRLGRVWENVGEGPVAFFGGDSPDVPDSALGEIPVAINRCQVAVGPTDDGGYWTLVCRAHHPEVLDSIDWGSANVYDQTCRRAKAAGLVVQTLPLWHDVDRPQDVDALRLRLWNLKGPRHTAPLRRLAERLDALLGPNPARQGNSS